MARKALKLSTFQIGTPAKRGQGLRLGTVRYPPRGVRKSEYVELGLIDVWLPGGAPSATAAERLAGPLLLPASGASVQGGYAPIV